MTNNKLPSEKSMWHKVYIESCCPYDNSLLKRIDLKKLEGSDYFEVYQCVKCSKKFKITSRCRDKIYLEVKQI